jgi:hypothetical protein
MALSDTKLKNLKPQDKAYKVADRDGMYVVVSPKGTINNLPLRLPPGRPA